jgi:hypothetical protein
MKNEARKKAKVYVRYPLSSVIIYNGATILHFGLGGFGINLGYGNTFLSSLGATLYVLFALAQMYLLMPRTVCSNCVYYKLENSLCVSGMNLFSRKIAKAGKLENFPERGKGLFCHNNLYMAALIIPIVAMIPALFIYFSYLLLATFLLVLGLMVFRIFVIFPKIACLHCSAKKICPNAQSMDLSDS